MLQSRPIPQSCLIYPSISSTWPRHKPTYLSDLSNHIVYLHIFIGLVQVKIYRKKTYLMGKNSMVSCRFSDFPRQPIQWYISQCPRWSVGINMGQPSGNSWFPTQKGSLVLWPNQYQEWVKTIGISYVVNCGQNSLWPNRQFILTQWVSLRNKKHLNWFLIRFARFLGIPWRPPVRART